MAIALLQPDTHMLPRSATLTGGRESLRLSHKARDMTDIADDITGYIVNHRPEITLIGLGLLLRLLFALLPRDLLFMLLEDDAWMVAAIARHWALGDGITADGLTPTNGFHPLYPLTLGALPYLAFPQSLHLGFRLNLLICALLNTLALFPFYSMARTVASRNVALMGLAIMALNPFLIRVSVNGMETSLALLLVLLLWWYALVINPDTTFGAVILGVLAALAIFARLDNIIAAGMLGLVLLWNELRTREYPQPVLSLTYATVTAILLLPYIIRNMVLFDALLPSSGRAVAYMHSFRESFAFTSGLQVAAYQSAFDLTWAPAWLLAVLLVGFAALFVLLADNERRFMTPLVLYTLALTFYYAYLQQQGRPRYYVAVGFVLVLLICAWLTLPEERRRKHDPELFPGDWRLAVAVVAVVLNIGLFGLHVSQTTRAPYQAQPAMYDAARWIAENLPDDARLGAQNSGIFQYYSERVVINLDGKLNHEIIPQLEQRRLAAYMRAEGIEYVVDLPGVADYIEFYSSSMSEAPPHYEMSNLQRLRTYGQLLGARLGLAPPVELPEREPERIIQSFESVTSVLHEEPLPNNPNEAVTVYRLEDEFGEQP